MKNFFIFAGISFLAYQIFKPQKASVNGLGLVENQEAKQFLEKFFLLKSTFGLTIRNEREKNLQFLLDNPKITKLDRLKTIEKLKAKDYYQGPIPDILNKSSDMWVFRKKVKGKLVYIKLSLGYPNKAVQCISFHL